jgi:hypothetical protein
MALANLFGQVMNAISNHADQQQHTGFDPSGLINEVQGLFGQHAANTGQVLPASQDPYGDPADAPMSSGTGYGNIRPASQDPLGDPADDADRARGIRPASDDPLGDPADQAA